MKYVFTGGINELNDIAIPATEAVSGKNFELGLGNTKFRPRKPFDTAGVTTNAGPINGICQLVKRNNSYTTLIASGTEMYEWDGATFTSKGTVDSSSEFHSSYWSLDDKMVMVDRNKATPVSVWDGTTFGDLAHGLGVAMYAKYSIVANGRLVLANVKTDTSDNPHLIAFSEFENIENFDTTSRGGDAGLFTTGNEPFYLLTPDLKPINALVYFQDTLICSTQDGQLFKLIGDDSTNYRWDNFYTGSSAIGTNSFVDVGNDLFYMREGGVIESLVSTDKFGDVGTDDVSIRLRDTLSNLDGMRGVYDRTKRKVYFFLQSKVLVLFKDMIGGENSPFSIYTTQHPSAFNTDAAEYVISPVTGERTVLFGDDTGNIYDMNGTGAGDAATYEIVANRKMPLQDFNYDRFLEGRVFYRRIAAVDLGIILNWGDEKNETGLIIPLKAPTAVSSANNYYGPIQEYYGSSVTYPNPIYYGEGIVNIGNPVSKGFSAMGKGTSVFVTLEITSSNYFEIDYIEV